MSDQGYGGPGRYDGPHGEPLYPNETGPPPPAPVAGGRNLLVVALSAVVVAGLLVFVLAVSGVFSGDDTPVADPTSSLSSDPVPTGDSSTGDSTTGGGDTADAPSGICASSVDARATATVFISYITLGNAARAEGCVYQGRVSRGELEALIGSDKAYSPSLPSDQTGPEFSITSSTGTTTLDFTVDQQSDGKYYVVSASES